MLCKSGNNISDYYILLYECHDLLAIVRDPGRSMFSNSHIVLPSGMVNYETLLLTWLLIFQNHCIPLDIG